MNLRNVRQEPGFWTPPGSPRRSRSPTLGSRADRSPSLASSPMPGSRVNRSPTPEVLSPLSQDIARYEREEMLQVAEGQEHPPLSEVLSSAVEARPARKYKYGFCDAHKCAFRPHIFAGGRRAGHAVGICARWLSWTKEGQRECWRMRMASREEVMGSWPKEMRELYLSLQRAGKPPA